MIKLYAIDFETALLSGEPSVEYWRPDFRVISCAIASDEGAAVYWGEQDIGLALDKLVNLPHGVEFIAHNLQFEMGVVKCRFPGVSEYLRYDTARLAQMADNGGKYTVNPDTTSEDYANQLLEMDETSRHVTGLSLQGCISRFLPESMHNHKEPFYALIRNRGGLPGKEGSCLNLLTSEELGDYNKQDAILTLTLYNEITSVFDIVGLDWKMDHSLYRSSVCKIVDSKIKGTLVDRERLQAHCKEKREAIAKVSHDFRERFLEQLEALEREYFQRDRMSYKTQKGRDSVQPVVFNPMSTKQLADLFVGKLGLTPKFTTETGLPSFKSKFLGQWGDGGEILKTQRTHLIELKQGERLLEKTEYDGRWHIDLRATGTKTNRFAGSGGLNVQGMSRRCESLMSCLVPDSGCTVVSIDLSSGEPTCTAHYSGDVNYYNAVVGMIGRSPYYDDCGILQISDIYLMTASVSPFGRDTIRTAFNKRWNNGMTFPQQWLVDEEVIKDSLKKCRNLHKTLCLGLSYGMGPKKLLQSAYEIGEELSKEQAAAFYRTYWRIFKGVKKLDKALAQHYKRTGRLQTSFGYCVYPDADYKAFNAFIQATVSGIMHSLNADFFERCNFARFITVIHDELLVEIPTDRLAEAKELWRQSVEWLNRGLKWNVKIRTGWVEGTNWFTAK